MRALRYHRRDNRSSVHEIRVLLLCCWDGGGSLWKLSLATAFARRGNGGWEGEGGVRLSDPASVLTYLFANWWVLWKLRNKAIFEQSNPDPFRAISNVSCELADWAVQWSAF